MKPWHEELDAATVQRIKTYSAFNDATSKNLMVQTAMEEGYRLAESIYQEQLIKYIDYVAERKLEEDFCKYKEEMELYFNKEQKKLVAWRGYGSNRKKGI